MDSEILVKGIVLREAEYRESDKILTVLTEKGKLTVTARGAKKPTGKNLSVCSLFCYSEMTLNQTNGHYYLAGGSVIESFYALREDLERLSAASAIAEITSFLTENAEDAPFFLKLCLNCLYFLCSPEISVLLVKSVFEAKCAEYSGFFPEFEGCDSCGEMTEKMYFSPDGCELSCSRCVADANNSIMLGQNVIAALRHIGSNGLAKAMHFTMNERDMDILSRITESILCTQLGRRFESLDYFRRLKL